MKKYLIFFVKYKKNCQKYLTNLNIYNFGYTKPINKGDL